MPHERRHAKPPWTFAAVIALVSLAAMFSVAAAERMPPRYKQPEPPTPVRHDTSFHKVPGATLQIRAVEYDGSTNGALTVEVKNPNKTAQTFTATGLYFIPDGDPDKAPQRLGAVGPLQLASTSRAQRQELTEVSIPAGQTVELVLDVFCIDSHRASPSPQNKFSVGAKRIPKELAGKIEQRATAAVAAERAQGAAAPRPAAKAKIQEEVWRSRDAKWIELDGEGKQEAGKRR
jgi:hypothetical protein